jgi:proteasome assembly chaperone 4
MTTADVAPTIQIHHQTIPSPLPSSPSFIFQLTRLKDTLFIWVGTGSPTTSIPGTSLNLDDELPSTVNTGEKRLASEWGVAMPSRGVRISLTLRVYMI